MDTQAVRHELIIRHPSRDLALLLRDDRGHHLPSVFTPDRHTAEVAHINEAVRQQFGVTTVFLRSLSHDDSPDAHPVERRHELAARDVELSSPAAEWCTSGSVPGLALPASGHIPADGCDWELPGWWSEATNWIGRALAAHGVVVTDVVQLRSWPSSSVLRIHTDGGDFYFKAIAHSLAYECEVTAYLAQHFPKNVPAILGVEHVRRWLLMRAVSGCTLEQIDVPAPWEQAARMYGEMQSASAAHASALRACGVVDRPLPRLRDGLELLARDHAELREVLPQLRRRCDELAASGIPPMLDHGDLWPGNFLIDGDRCALIDWECAALGHPFLSIAPLMVGLREHQPALANTTATERILAAYLAAFSAFAAPAQLRRALDLALPLAFCDMALRYREQPAAVVRLHPWMRGLVPEALQRAIAAITCSSSSAHGIARA